MELNQFFLIAGGLLLFSLLMIGGGIAMYRGQQGRDTERIAAEKEALLAEPAAKPAEGEPERRPQPAAGLEILRVTRRPVDGGLTVETMGEPAGHAAEMTPGQVEQLKRIVREVALWVEGREAHPPQPGPGAAAAEAAPETGSASAPQTLHPPGSFAESLPRVPEARDMLPFRRKNIPKLEEAPEPPKSIVAQIDEILQAMVGSSPHAGSVLRLSEDPGGGLLIVHGARTYHAIDEVEDETARALIQSAVQAWNEQNKLKN